MHIFKFNGINKIISIYRAISICRYRYIIFKDKQYVNKLTKFRKKQNNYQTQVIERFGKPYFVY